MMLEENVYCQNKPAVFFDRDGVLNVDVDYLYKKEDFIWIDGAIKSIQYLNNLGYYVFVITNQSGIARGYYTEEDLFKLHNWMNNELRKNNAHIDHFFYCPHHKNGVVNKYAVACNCRKPNIGMILEACNKYDVCLKKSVLIGDRQSDLECAKRAGIKGILFNGINLYDTLKLVLEKFD